jgi:hypothetical protein
VILDNDESDEAESTSSDVDTGHIRQDTSPHNTLATLELESRPTESIDTSGPWFDVEEGCYVEEPPPSLRSYKQQGVILAPVQDQPQTLLQSFQPLQDQISQQDVSSITRSMSVDPAPHFLPQLPNGDDGRTNDSMAELEKELELAFLEQGNSSSASAPTSPCPRSVEAPQDEIQSRERTDTTGKRLEELQNTSRHGTAQGLE